MASEADVGGRRPHHGGTASGEPHPRPAAPAPAGRRRWLALAAVLVLGVAFALGVRSMQQVVASRPQPGRPAPDFTLPQLDGPAVRLAGLRGRVVAVNFWASWCEPCREEAPALQAFYERYGDRLAFYGINVAEPVDTVRDFIAEFGLTYPVLLDRDRAVSRRYGVVAFPETWWIDPEGIARVHWVGPMTFEDMQRLYEQAAGEPIDPEGSGPVAPGQRLLDLVI
ncbi:MAG TPA: TlpA disulfide reductase family protein, partial [Thermaerobacter sp.]